MRRHLRRVARAYQLLASERRKLWARLTGDVRFGAKVEVKRGVLFRTFDGGRIVIGADVEIWPNVIIEAKGALIAIGPHSLVNAGTYIAARHGITIGSHALIAEHVTIRDADHGLADPSRAFTEQAMEGAAITIGHSVWLAAKVTVTKGVSIGDRVVVGANAVVTRSLAANGRYAGVPARPMIAATFEASTAHTDR